MKILSLNTHSLVDGDSEEKVKALAEEIFFEAYDLVFLQEVNQKRSLEAIAKDNFAYRVQKKLFAYGLHYHLYYDKVHLAYDRFDEGLAILSLAKAEEHATYLVSKSDDYEDFRRRKVQMIKYEGMHFYNVHFGWEDDPLDPFSKQWAVFEKHLQKPCIVAGDFNLEDADEKLALYDSYHLAEKKSGYETTLGSIDGWEEAQDPKRIDYVFVSEKARVLSHHVVLDGDKSPLISDHYALSVSFADE